MIRYSTVLYVGVALSAWGAPRVEGTDAIVSAAVGGFDQAIDAALARVVKLYGVSVGTQVGYGSGVLVSEDGLVVTVFSIVIDAARPRVVTADGTTFGAEVVARDARRQLALLQLRHADGSDAMIGPLPYFETRCAISESESEVDLGGDKVEPCLTRLLQPGDWVLAAGNAFQVAVGAEPVSLTHGVFSARTRLDARRRVKDFPYRGDVLVIDAITSNPGAPGGAVVNLHGEFVGLIGREVISNLTHTHFNYAIPRDVVAEFVQEFCTAREAGEAASLARLDTLIGRDTDEPKADPGIRLTRTGYKRLPPMVERVQWGSPAETAGVRKDDLILSVNGRNVADVEAYEDRMSRIEANEPIDLVVQRGRRIVNLRIEPTANEKSSP